jgi:hypothetical protein
MTFCELCPERATIITGETHRRNLFGGKGSPASPCCVSVWSTAPNGLFDGLIWPKAG